MKIYMISPSGKVTEVVPAKGKLTTIKQVNGSKLQFVDDAPTDTPKVIKTKKIGDNLELFTNNTEIADIVVENYFIDAQAMPTIFNENIGLTTEVGSITLESTVNPIFIASVEGASASMIAGVVLGVGGVAAMASGGSGSSTITTNTTPSSVEIVNKDGFTSGTASAKVTLGSSVHAGDTITIVLKATNGTTNDTSDDTTLATYIHTVTSGDLSAGYFSQTLAQETASDVYTVETTINATQLGTKHLTVSVDGVLSDDYLAYSTVFIDTNNDGKLDWTDANNDGQWQEGEGEAWTTTDSSGHFSFTIDPNGAPIVAIGGVDTASGNPNNIVYKMFSSATSSVDGVDIVISPLSTIIAAIIEKNAAQNGTTGQAVTEADVLAAVSTVASAFGLTVSDPKTFLTYDVVKETQAEASSYNNELLTLSREIAVVLSTTSALIDGAVSTTTSSISGSENFGTGTTAAASAFADLIVNKVASGDTVSLTMPADVESIMNSAMTKANEIIQNTDIQITASIPADIVTLSTLISSFNQQVSDLTATNGAQDITVINTLRAVIDTVVPALSQAGAEAATDRGGDISLSSAISTLNSAINNDIPTYITQQVTAVEAKTEQFLANDVSGTAEQLSKIVLQMPSLGVGDTIDTLTISTTLYKYIEKDASTQPDKVVTGKLKLWTVNPVTKQATHLIASEDGYYHLDPAIAGYLYVKTVDAIDCYLDVKATNTVDNTETDYSGAVKIHMEPAVTIISPTLAVTAVTDDFGTVTGVITKNGQTNDATPTVSGTITFPILSDGQAYLASYKVAIYDGGAYLGLATVQNDGTWSFTSPVLSPDGVKNIVARIVVGIDDANGSDFVTHYATSAYSVILDAATPAPTINPTDGKILTGIAEAGATVTVKNESGTTIGTAIVDASGKWALTLGTQLPDTSKVKAMATDTAGNQSGYSDLTTVEYNTPTTLCTITSVTDNVGIVGEVALTSPVKLTSSVNTYTNDSTPTLSGTLSSALLVGETVKIFNGETEIGTATVTGTTWIFTPTTPLGDAGYALAAKVYNGSKYGQASSVFEFNVDTGVPAQTLTFTSVTDDVQGIIGEITSESTTNDSKPTFAVHLSAPLAENESVVAYYIDANGKSVRMGTATISDNPRNGIFTPTTALPDGVNRVYFQVEDTAGNMSAKTDNFVFTVDTVAPSAPTIDTTQPSVGSIEETGGIICTMTKPAGSTLSIDSTTGDDTLFTINQDGVVHAVGLDFESKTTYTFTVLATDTAGNFSKKTVTVTATDVVEADSIVAIAPSTLQAVNTPAAGEMVSLEFTVTRTESVGSAEVNWSVSGLSASDYPDGVLPYGTVTFTEGELTATITVEVPASLTLELTRHVGVTIDTQSSGYMVDSSNATATIDVVDNATVETATERYSVSCDHKTILEGAQGNVTALTYTIKLLAGDGSGIGYVVKPMGSALVTPDDFCDIDGDALSSDLPFGDIVFVDGIATVTVYVKGDNAVGPDEQFALALTGVSNSAIITGDAIVTVQNDDAYVTVTPREIDGAMSGEVTNEFVITRTGNTDVAQTVHYVVYSAGENGTDLFDTEESIELTFEAGKTQKVISFTTTGDEVINGYKSFGIELEAGENVTLLNKVAMSTINPNVQDVEIVTNIDRTLEGGLAEFSYTVTRSGDVSEALDVPWSIVSTQENGVSATDFGGTLPSGTIHFAAGATTATVAFSSSTDTTLEGDEGFRLVLDDTSLPEYIRLINPSVSGVIVDDESAVGFNQSSTFSVVEGDNGSSNLVVTVTRVGFTGNESSVDWALSFDNGEEKATLSDLFANQALLGTVTFKPGEASAVITIKINGDTSYENGLDESFTLTLSNPSSGTKLIGGTGESGVEFDGYSNATTATIINDDSLISVSASTFSEVEGQGGSSKYMEITIKREGSTVGQDWVKWSLVSEGDGAVNNEDLGEANDAISVFDSYENSWIDIASLTGNNAADGSISLSKDGYIMVSYNRDWSYGEDNLPFDQFLLNHLSVEGGTLSALGSLVNQNGLISSLAENSIEQNDENLYAIYTADNPGGLELPGIEEGGNRVVISADKSLGDWYFTVSGNVNGKFMSETIRGPIDGSVSTSNYFTNVMSITREPAHVAIGLVSSNGKDGYDATAIDSEVELPYGSGLIEGIGDWQYDLQEGIVGAENIGSSRVVIKSEADLSDTTFVIHGGISVGYIQNGYYEGPTFENITENGQQDNTVTFDTPTHINVEAVSMTGIMDEFYNAMSHGEFPFNATTNYFLVSGLDADGEAYEEVVAAKDILEVDFEDFSLSSGVQIDSLSSNENLLETTLLPQEGENAGRVALGFVMNGVNLSKATFTITGKDAEGNDITDVIHGPSSPEKGNTYDSSTVLSNKYFTSVSSIVSDNDAGEISLIIGLTKPVQTTGEFSVVYGIKACDVDGEPLEDFEGMKLLSEGAGRFEFTAPVTIELQGANNGVAISEQGLSYVDYIEVVKTADDATIQIGYDSATNDGEENPSSGNMLISNENDGLSGNVFFTYCCGDNYNYETGNPATFPYNNTAYAIFKLDVTGESATVNFDVEQLGRYGIDTGKLSYAPEGTFSTSSDDMVYENEGANLLIPALKSPLALTTLDLSAFIDEDNYAIDSVSSFYIVWIDEDNLYFNVGTSENPNWVYSDLESSYIDVQDIVDGKLSYIGSTIKMRINACDAEEEVLGSTEIFTGIYTTISMDAFSGDFDAQDAQYVHFDWIGGENFYVNTSDTETPNWVNVYEQEGYVSVSDIADGKLAYLGSRSDFKAYVYDSDENQLEFIENVEYHVLSARELATDGEGGYTGYDVGADQFRMKYIKDGELYYNMGTSDEPEWIEYNEYEANYNNDSEYYPIQDVLDGKFAYVGEFVELSVRFYTDGDSESSIYPYIEASAVDAPSEIATQTGEVTLDGSGYIWLRYDNNENGGNDGADMAWINNLHIVDPAGHATIEVVGQKVIKDGVAHEQELGGAGTLQLDGIAIKNTPIIDDNGNNLIAITTLKNGTMGTRSDTGIYVTDMNDQENEFSINASGLATSTARSGMSTLTTLGVNEAKSVIYDQADGSDTMADRTISLVHGNLSSLASNAEVIDPNALHVISLETLVNRFVDSKFLDDYEATSDDIALVYFENWFTDDNCDLYYNQGTIEEPNWVSFNGGDIQADDIRDGKLAFTGSYLKISYPEFSLDADWEDSYYYRGYDDIGFPEHVITLEDIASMYGNYFSANDIGSVYVKDSYVDDYLWYNYGTDQNPEWDYYFDDYPTMSAQDIADGKFAYSGDYVKLYAYIGDNNGNSLVDYRWSSELNPAQPNPYTLDTIEVYQASDGSIIDDEPSFMHAIVSKYGIDSDDSVYVLDDTLTMDGNSRLTFTSRDDLSDRTITIEGYVEGSDELVTETITEGPNGSTVVATHRFVRVKSIEVSEGENEVELSVGSSIAYDATMTLFAKSVDADTDGSICITGLDGLGNVQTITYENILDGLSKSMGEFKEIFAITTEGISSGSIEFSAVEGDGFIDVALNGTRDEDGYIALVTPQRITISNNGGSGSENQEFRIVGLDEEGNTVTELISGIMNDGAYVSTHYFSKILTVEAGLLDGVTSATISVGTISAPVTPEQAMSVYGGEVIVNDSMALFETPSQITFSSEDNLTSRVFTITGTDAHGATIVENVTGANGGIAISSHKFMSVSSISVDEGAVGSVKVGYTTSGGMTDNFVVTGSGTAADPFVGHSTNTTEGTESDVLLFVNFNGSAPGSVKLSYDLAVQGATNSDTLYVEYSSTINSLLQGKVYFEDGESETTIRIPVAGDDTKEGDEGMSLTLVSGSTGTTIDAEHNTTDITILNDDDIVTLDATAKTVVEGNDDAHRHKISFTITREDDVTDKKVFWSIGSIGGDGQAEEGDFEAIRGSVTFAMGSKTATIDVYVSADRIYEGVETFTLVLDTPPVGSGYSLNNAVANGTITEDDVGVSIEATDTSKNETDGSVTHTFTVTRVGDTTQASSINWAVSGTSGTSDIDAYVSDFGEVYPSGNLNFAANETTKTITVTTDGDNQMTGDRAFDVTLSNATDDTSDIYHTVAIGSIIEDDAVSLTIDQARQIENTGSEKTATYTLTRADGTHAATYNWKVLLEGDGLNAIAGAADFSASQDALNSNSGLPSGSVTFAEGETTATITLKIANDDILEADEAFKLHFQGADASVAAAQDIMSYIVNNIVGYGIDVKVDGNAVDNNSIVEGSGTDKTITVTFMRAGDSSQSATLTYSIAGTGVHAITADDFTGMASLPTDVSVTFEPWQSAITRTFVLSADSLKEETESFEITLKDGANEVASQTVDVTNDDAGLVLEVDKSDIAEGTSAFNATGDATYTTLTYTVYRSGDKSHSSDVKWRVKTSDGISIDDFVEASDALGTNDGLPSGSIHFNANDAATSKTFTLNVKKDSLYEGLTPENLIVELYDASVGTDITTSTVTTIIRDDDKEVGFASYTVDSGSTVNSINAVVTEGDPSSVTMVTDEWVVLTYKVVRTGNDRDGSQTVTWNLAGEAFDGADAATVDWYQINDGWNSGDVVGFDSNGNKATGGTLVFADNNDNEKYITIKVHKDHYQENPEAFKITLVSDTPGLSVNSTTGVARGTITDDDIALVLSSDSATRVVHSEGQLDTQGNTVYTEYTWKIERKGAAEAVDLNWSIQGYGDIHDVYYSDRYSSDGYGWSNGGVPAATANTSDFEEITNTVHFTADDTYKYLTIRVVGDAVVESTEAFRVVLTKPANVDDITRLGNYLGSPETSYFEGIILRDEGRFGVERYELDINSAANFDNEDYSTINDVSDAKAEGNSGYVSHFIKIYRDFTTSGDATIEWRLQGMIPGSEWDANGTYDNNPFLWHNKGIGATQNDFEAGQNGLNQENGMPSGIATIPDGESYTIIEIKTSTNVTAEDLKGYLIALSNPSAGSTLDAYNQYGEGYIANDDNPLFSIGQIVHTNDTVASYGSQVVVEGDAVTYTVYRTGSTTYEAKVDWSVIFPDPIGGSSTTDTNSASNYTALAADFDTATLSGTLTFAAGQNSQTITLPIKNDGAKESWAEAFSVRLDNARWGDTVPQNIKDAQTPAISQVAGTMESIIVDNSGATSLVSVSAVNNATGGYEGGLGGSNTITYTLTRTGDYTQAAQIGWTLRTPSGLGDYVSIDGDTTEATYTPPNSGGVSYAVGLVSFGAGEHEKTITLTYANDTVVEDNENFVFTLVDGKTVLEEGYTEWMAPWYYGTGSDTTANANNSGLYFLDASGRIPDSDDMYRDPDHYTTTTMVKNDDGTIYINNTYSDIWNNQYIGTNLYEGDTGSTTFTASITRTGRIDHDVTVQYQLVDSQGNPVQGASGTWELFGIADDEDGNGSKTYTMSFDLGTANFTPEANKSYTLKLSNISDTNIYFKQNGNDGGATSRDIPVTVLNDDTVWSLTPGTLSQNESDDSVTEWTFTITRPSGGNNYGGEASVTYQIVSNGANYTIDSSDIVGGTGERTVNFAAGQYSQVVTFNVTGDKIAERNESFNVELVSANHGVIHETDYKATYTIVNDDTTVEIHNATSVIEGDVDGAYLEFDVVRKGQIGNGSSTVNWAVQDDSATAADDLTAEYAKPGTLSFDAGSTYISEAITDGYGEQTQTVRVNIKGDTTVEAHQSLSVSLSGATDSDGIAAGKTLASGTILNDESVFTLSAGTAVNEGDTAGQKFTITRSALTGQPQTINWAVTSDGSSHAVDGSDGVLATGSVTFAPNEWTKEIYVTSTKDAIAELDEVFKFSIAVANETTGATISGNDYAYGVVLNDDAGTPTVSQNDSTISIDADASAVEGDSGTQYVAFTLTRGGTLTYDASVDWHIEIAGKTATAADFGGTLPSGTLTMPNGQTSFTINVPISGDSAYEGDETFTLVLDNPEPGLEITTATAVGTITNDDCRISVVDNVVVDENAGIATFTLSRTEPYTESNSVTWTLTPSANVLGNGDISGAMTGTAVFAENVSTTTVVVYLNDDAISEGDEIFNLTLSNPTAGADLDPDKTTKTLTITNDDRDVITYSVDATSKSEGDGDGWTTYTVSVNRQNPTTTLSVDWAVEETSEINLSDIIFDATNGTVSFVGTSLSATFDIKVKTDDMGDFDKYFKLSLSSPTTNDSMGAYVDTSNTTVQVDNDDPAFSVALTADTFVEGSGATSKLITFVVTRDGDASGVASVTWTIAADEDSDNPANLSDFGGYWPSGTTVFMDGESSKTIQVAIAPDSTFELSEGFKVVLSELVSQTQGARIIVDTDAGVIVNDDIGVSVSVDESSVVEGNEDDSTDVTFTLSAEGVANKTVTVYFTLEGSGLSPADEFDFSFSEIYNDNDWDYDDETGEGRVVLRTDGDGNAEASVIVTVNGDIKAGANETFRLRVTEVEGGTVADGSEVVTIENDDTAIASIVNSTSVDTKEGNDGTTTYTFTLTRSGSVVNEAEVSYVIKGFGDNQANADDFINGQLPSGKVTFDAGSDTATINVEVKGDTTFESNEGFVVIVGKDTPNEVRLATEILNDDSASLIVNGIVTTVKEGNNSEHPNYLSYEVVRNGDNSEALDVAYSINGNQTDFVDGLDGLIAIPAGESRVVVNIAINPNIQADADRIFNITFSAVGFEPVSASGTIVDDDTGVSIELLGVSQQDEDVAEYTFRVNRVGNNLVDETIAWTLAGLGLNPAVASDFESVMNGEVNFIGDETVQTFTITVASDTVVENNEDFRVSINSNLPETKILIESVDCQIVNDDSATSSADVIFGGMGVDILKGLGGNDIIHGGAGADVIFGGDGDDTIYAEGGADVIYAGLGDDTIVVESIDFMLIDGGLGFDTLKFENFKGLTLDFANFEGEMKSIEAIDISGYGEDTLASLTYDTVFAINENHELYIKSGSDDSVDMSAFTATNTTMTLNTVVYDVYQATQNDLHVNLYIHQNTIG